MTDRNNHFTRKKTQRLYSSFAFIVIRKLRNYSFVELNSKGKEIKRIIYLNLNEKILIEREFENFRFR